MKEDRIKIKGWYNRFDSKLKSLREEYTKMDLIKSDILENQRILNEYKIDEQNKEKKVIIKSNKKLINRDIEKALLNRVNIKNFKQLDVEDNIFLVNILQKIKDIKENNKNNKSNKKLPFKRYKTNNDYGNINYLLTNDNNNQFKPRKNLRILTKINNNESRYNKIQKEKPLIIKQKTDLILNTEQNKQEFSVKDIINYNNNKNKTENNINFFETLSQVDNHEINKNNSKNKDILKIHNRFKVVKLVKDKLHNCELSGNLLNKNIKDTQNLMKLSKSLAKYKNKKLKFYNINNNIKINYSKIKDIKDVEKNIFNENIKNNKSELNIRAKSKKDKDKINKNKSLLLPICTPNNKSYIKPNSNILKL